VKHARGSAQRPMSDRELEYKLRINARSWERDYDAEPLIAAIWGLDNNSDAGKLMTLAVPQAAERRRRA
jgi:hypothetical protein